MIAALYVETNGPYANLPGVDVWDEARDARTYAGPWPVVAHPPCARWSLMALCRGTRDGDDGGCFAAALDAVDLNGGVLEHPAHSLAWKRFGLSRPPARGWGKSLFDRGWVCQVDQSYYGHPCRKLTWLYYVGGDPPEMRWGDGGRRIHSVRNMHRDPRNGRDRSGARSRTPDAFRDALLEMARRAANSHPGSDA